MPPTVLPDGLAFFVPAGSKFVFQMHYTANGSPAKDRSCVGLVFSDVKDVKNEARTMNAGNPFSRSRRMRLTMLSTRSLISGPIRS